MKKKMGGKVFRPYDFYSNTACQAEILLGLWRDPDWRRVIRTLVRDDDYGRLSLRRAKALFWQIIIMRCLTWLFIIALISLASAIWAPLIF